MDNRFASRSAGAGDFGEGNDMEELIKRLERVIATGAPDKDGQHPISAETVLKVVKQLPPIQPKRGRWEMGIDERFVECSECGLMTTRNELRGIAVFGKNEPNFCPNCGADMRGEQ